MSGDKLRDYLFASPIRKMSIICFKYIRMRDGKQRDAEWTIRIGQLAFRVFRQFINQ